MLLPNNTNPAFSTYFYGAVVLKAFIDSQDIELDFLELFQQSNLVAKASIKSFVLALDWLYLINAIKIDENFKLTLLKRNAHVPEAT